MKNFQNLLLSTCLSTGRNDRFAIFSRYQQWLRVTTYISRIATCNSCSRMRTAVGIPEPVARVNQ